MNIYGPDFFDDTALIAEIKAYAASRREVMLTGYASKVSGEGRLVEWTRSGVGDLDRELREMMYEARQRGLSIGGDPDTAILVEIG